TASEIISALNLSPHPEGGYFIQTFVDSSPTPTSSFSPPSSSASTNTSSSSPSPSAPPTPPRPASTSIYYLLPRPQTSLWHRIDAVETWHFYTGSPLLLSLSHNDGSPTRHHVLGPDILGTGGEAMRPQVVVARGEWMAARSLGDWTLVGCTVAPGFRMEGFEMPGGRWKPLG
ncbi:hypothetical protein M501DRAFT_904445, partial [Patellaria atrata CBS 101060]